MTMAFFLNLAQTTGRSPRTLPINGKPATVWRQMVTELDIRCDVCVLIQRHVPCSYLKAVASTSAGTEASLIFIQRRRYAAAQPFTQDPALRHRGGMRNLHQHPAAISAVQCGRPEDPTPRVPGASRCRGATAISHLGPRSTSVFYLLPSFCDRLGAAIRSAKLKRPGGSFRRCCNKET